MRRLITALMLIAGPMSIAGAHTLDAGEGLLAQLFHELLGVHHLPLTGLLLVVGVAIFRLRHKRSSGIGRDDR